MEPQNPATTPAADAKPADPPAPGPDGGDAAQFSEAAKNAAAKKARLDGQKEGRNAVLRELAEQTGIPSLEDLIALAKAQTQAQSPDTKAAKASAQAKADEERAKLTAENTALRVALDEQIVKNTIYPIMSSLNVRDPEVAAVALKLRTGNDVVRKDGKVVVVDSDGDVLSEDPAKWLAEQFRQEAFLYLVKPTTAATQKPAAPGKNGDAKPKAKPTSIADAMAHALRESARSGGSED